MLIPMELPYSAQTVEELGGAESGEESEKFQSTSACTDRPYEASAAVRAVEEIYTQLYEIHMS